jgi:hypothetical protein
MIKFPKYFIGGIDSLIVKLGKWKHIPNSKNNFMYINPYQYKRKTITLKDGTVIAKGDLVAEIHIDNSSIKRLNTGYANLFKLLNGELKALKESYDTEPYSGIKAIYGITVFYDIARRQGFTVVEMDNKIVRFFGSLWENILRLLFKNGNKKTRKKFIYSKECWLSKNQILEMK